MPDTDWAIPPAFRPVPTDYRFDLDRTIRAVFSLKATVPEDAFTARTLGTEREGSAVAIEGGLLATIGYLVTEAETIWLTATDGTVLPAHAAGIDQRTGIAVLQPLGRLGTEGLKIAAPPETNAPCILAAGGGPNRAVATKLVARQEFAGYWEYVLDEALFTAPAHPFWGGAALLDGDGALVGIGSLVLQEGGGPAARDMNMAVPAALLPPALETILTTGRGPGAARPWLGLFAAEQDGALMIAGIAEGGPADQAGVRAGEAIRAVDGVEISELAELWRTVWARGDAGVEITLSLARGGRERQVRVATGDRGGFLKRPRMH